ncbi:AAA family ATPase [Fibrella aquatilis]|uniref:AAA family ATPase n=1 Tax=Fibrella aquatilis TaxID=2817059 RepID=A0A939GC85_9BACT|nr:AAA family ATPase [Fibrella aquatilis]MBO0934026.1 AAA family ATPase [Fibrella aquatilis]
MNPYRIESLHLTQVGPFEELELVLPVTPENEKAEVHILTGENGTGKTSVLEAIATIFGGNSKRLVLDKMSEMSRIDLCIYSNISLFFDRTSPSNSSTIFSGTITEEAIDGKTKYCGFAYSGNRQFKDTYIRGTQEQTRFPLYDSLEFESSINFEDFLQWVVNTRTRELVSKAKNKQGIANQQRKNLKTLEQALSTIVDSELFFDVDEENFQPKINVDRQLLNFNQIPDGLKSMVSWLGDLLMRMDRIQWDNDIPVLERPFLLLLDEIDVHLHPAWQRKILPMVQSLFPNAQVIVSTHSPFVVGSVDGAWVHRFKKEGTRSVLDGPPILSEDARSYEYILEEIFGIKEHFGIEVEKRLTEFQQLKKQLLKRDETFDESRFRQLIDELRGQSTELDSLLGMELNQLQRLTQKSFIE